MPKGAVLHLHYDAFVDYDWFVNDILTDSQCYFNTAQKLFGVFKTPDKAP